ncbi:MAG TPA: hypothetical protein VLB44_18005, partial [Kofleriaceae bacterium]|nr:hypothetical protein [Kofleriaceae bacterium]
MRVIDQARLWFREGTSDKVYEIDLVEVATGQYVVNFRFGRRGGALKDGTKTSLPVALDKARGIFGKLVDEKLAGGYQHAGTAAPAPPPISTPLTPTVSVQHTSEMHTLIAALRQGGRATTPLGPVAWRITDLDMKEAEPVLLELAASPFVPGGLQKDAWRHLLITALVRCGGQASLPMLAAYANPTAPESRAILALGAPTQPVRDMAKLGIAKIAPDRARDLARPMLQPAILAAYEKSDSIALARAAEELLTIDPMKGRACAVALYLINDAVARPAVLAIARVARLSNTEAAIVRALFRLAEARRDGELYALLARRIDAYGGRARPFSPRTRQYLRRRVARVLRRLGRASSPDYVTMASAILLGYDDEDAVAPKRGVFRHQYDAFAPFHAFNQILYTHSPRYEKGHHGKSFWICARGWRPNAPAPVTREEAFPALWDRAPNALWELILKSGATPVIEFSTRALRANKPFTDSLRDEQIANVLASGHPLAQEFAFDIARTRPLT